MNVMFKGILMLVADTSEQLRRCDVYRVMDAAKDKGCLNEFTEWLKTQPVSTAVLKEVDHLMVEEFTV